MNYIHITKENIDKEHICCAMSGKQSLAKKNGICILLTQGIQSDKKFLALAKKIEFGN